MKRREFIKLAATVGITSALPLWSRYVFAADRPTLPIPQLLIPDASNSLLLTAQQGTTQFDAKTATTWGYNGNLLGPTLKLQQGSPVTVTVKNQLAQATTLHWHGLEIPGDVDGGPQGVIKPGASRTVTFTPTQQAATCWYHPHLHGKTGYQVAMGLAGLVLIEDPIINALSLPKQWGVDDVPLIIQDKRFKDNGQIDYQLDMTTASLGWHGDTLLVNGVTYPQHAAPKGWLRLRILNGSNARSLNLTTVSKRPMYVIASDGGLLAEPVKVTELPMMPGERFEVMMDTSDGKAFDLLTQPVSQVGMGMPPFDEIYPVLRILPVLSPTMAALPDTLATLPALPPLDGLTVRNFTLSMDPTLHSTGHMADMNMKMDMGMNMNMDMDHAGKGFDLHHANRINGKAFDMNKPMFAASKGKFERWAITGAGDEMLHPFHIHGAQFRILSENGAPPEAHRTGWKDTVRVEGDISEVLVKFEHDAPKKNMYMAHCHLLEHEDTGMMLGFTV